MLAEAGIVVCKVAGVTYHEGILAPGVNPDCLLTLVPVPKNPCDKNAVAVWDAECSVQVGYIPKRTGLVFSTSAEGDPTYSVDVFGGTHQASWRGAARSAHSPCPARRRWWTAR